MLEPLDHDEDKDFTTEEFEGFDPVSGSSLSTTFAFSPQWLGLSTTEEFEDFDPDTGSSLSITFAFSRKGGGLSSQSVYLDEEKLKNKLVLTRLHKIQVAAAELPLIGEKL